MPDNVFILGVILAGGRSMRMGQDKTNIEIGGRRLVDIVHERLAKQVVQVVTNAPKPVIKGVINIPDLEPDLKGPLAGLLAAYDWAAKNIKAPYAIVTVAVDTPFFPKNLVARLSAASSAAVASHRGEIQPTCGFWPDDLNDTLLNYRKVARRPSIRDFAKQNGISQIAFEGVHDFFNINTPEDLEKAKGMAGNLL